MKPMCIYHKNCVDGFGAAWSIWKKHGHEFDYHAANHGEDPPASTRNRDIYIVDFSYKTSVVEELAQLAGSVTVIDHHVTAEADLKPLLDAGIIDGVFDMSKSGAMLTWEWFHPGAEPPQLLKHIQDRDLWKFELDGTREIQAALFSYPYEFEIWDKLICATPIDDLYQQGIVIENKNHKDVVELVTELQREMVIGGYSVPVANLPYTLTSESAHRMAQDKPFAACYWDTPTGRTFSLRSSEDGIDVAEIAAAYGGGGHKHASGFRVPFDQLVEKGLL